MADDRGVPGVPAPPRCFPCAARLVRVSLILVSGLSGAGKSMVYRELLARGVEAHGFDEDRFGEWFDRFSGEPTNFPTRRGPNDTDHLEFRVHRDKIADLAHRSRGRVVFLCGGAGHEFKFWELLDLVIYLSVDDDTLRQRLTARTDNGYGQTPDELASILEANATFEPMYREHGAVVVDASGPIDEIVRDVLSAAPST